MEKDIKRKPRLAIISDTGMYLKGGIFIFEPVFREVQNFSHLFSEIYWLGYEIKKYIPSGNNKFDQRDDMFIINSYDKYPVFKRLKKYSRHEIPSQLNLFPVKFSGGKSILSKSLVIFFSPYYFIKILMIIMKSDIVFTRGPSIPALMSILISFFTPRKKYWHKYAGNWQLDTKTTSYRLQKWLLKIISTSKVIVNNRNRTDSKHIYSLVNPCLSENEYNCNKKYGLLKKFDNKLTFCYVGRLTKNKGFELLLDSIGKLKQTNWIEKLHCVGDGPLKNEYLSLSESLCVPICFHGLLDREELNKIYQDSHFIILPSQSEGFPKVLAEAASFGTIPIITPIASVTKNINKETNNGIVMYDFSSDSLLEVYLNIMDNRSELTSISKNAIYFSKQFFYEKYNKRIKTILNI